MRIKRKILIFLLSSLILLFFGSSVLALEITYPRMPGMDETPEECLELDSEEKLGCFVKYIYHFLLTISGLVCFFAIISGGVLYLISGGSVEKLKDAREKILVGILGTVLLLSSFIILHILNPELLILRIGRPEIEEPVMPEVPEYEIGVPVYVEIPLGRLLERVKIVAGIADYWSFMVWYEGAEGLNQSHSSLKELTQCLKKLTDKCDCGLIETDDCPPPPGQCEGDPCDIDIPETFCQDIDKSIVVPTNVREAIEEVNAMIPQQNDEFLEKKTNAQAAKEALDYANSRLKLGEALIRDSITPALNYDSFIALEDKEITKLWIYEDVSIATLIGPAGLPTPPQRCSADALHEIVPSCTICAADPNLLRCYGNAFRLCKTDSAIPPPNQTGGGVWLDPTVFPSGRVLYNEVTFSVPLGGVYVCDANVYGCVCPKEFSEPKDDPATFYITERGNEDIFAMVENLLSAPPPRIPPPEPLPPVNGDEYPPGPPPPVEADLQTKAMWVQQKTGVRASLILALLYHESGLRQFPGSGRYPGSFCCQRRTWWKINNCDNFDKIWNEVGYLYPQYTKYTVPVSPGGYIGGVYNCGGAMGPAQSMPFTWMSNKAEIKLITGKNIVSPWEFLDAFVLAALHLRDRGGADSMDCDDEKAAVCNYWGDSGCRNYSNYAISIIQRSNGIAQHKQEIGAPGNWTMCNGEEPPPSPPPGGDWQWPVESPTVLSKNAQAHRNGCSVCAWDFTAPCGREIYPAKPGTVTYAGCNNAGGYGCWVSIDHGVGWKSYYGHMQKGSINVSPRDYVTTNTILGKVGCTGYTEFGPHVHFEVFGPSIDSSCVTPSYCPRNAGRNDGRTDPAKIFTSPTYKLYCYGLGCPTGNCNPITSNCPCTGDPRGHCW